MKNEFNILLVEDNEGDVRIIRELLREVSTMIFNITSTKNLVEARISLSQETFDCILLDLGLPDSSGIETFLKLKNYNSNFVATIILTGLNDSEVGLMAVNSGAQDYLVKGKVDADKLAKSIIYSYERKNIEKDLLKSEHELKKAQQITHIGSWYLDIATNQVVWTEELYKMYGFDPSLPPPPYTEHMKLFTPESWAILSSSLEKTRQTGIPYELELRTVRKDGGNGWMWVRGEAQMDSDGKVYGLWGAAQDISERKEREKLIEAALEKAKESDRLKSAFLANMSHEIRTPMNGIIGFADLLKEPSLKEYDQMQYIELIEKCCKRLLNLVNDIIDISKIEARQVELYLSEFHLNELIYDLFSSFIQLSNQKGLQLYSSIPDLKFDPIIYCDHDKLFSILSHFLKNSVKFTHHGHIEFGYTMSESEIEFFVRDTGVGIDESKNEIIFENFRQGSESLSREYEGAGLGLSITKAFADMLHGTVRFDSNLGVGTTFYLKIPIHVPLENQSKVTETVLSESDSPQIRKLKILIVEDDQLSELLLINSVKDYCRDIIISKTGGGAVDYCIKNPDIDLILMDIKLPDISGYEATTEIRKFNKEVIIIAQTAYARRSDIEKALSSGCNNFISKPITKRELNSLIFNYFRN